MSIHFDADLPTTPYLTVNNQEGLVRVLTVNHCLGSVTAESIRCVVLVAGCWGDVVLAAAVVSRKMYGKR